MKHLDDHAALTEHATLIRKKRALHELYVDFYHELKARIPRTGTIVELGSGGGFLKEIIPRVITSDVLKGAGIDRVFKAEKMPFKAGSVSAFVMLNTFHHIKRPEGALHEMERALKPGGKIVMIEPWNTPWSRFIYTHFHHETFDPAAGWNTPGRGPQSEARPWVGRMSDANGALPWIVFHRDVDKFSKKFPHLRLVEPPILHTPMGYLLTGGLSRPQLLPTPFFAYYRRIERMNLLLFRRNGMFATISLHKRTI